MAAAGAVIVSVSSASAAISAADANRLAAAARVVQEIRGDIPQDYWDRARCVAVIPELKKAAFIVGGEYGKGVMSCRAGDQWSAPVFMQLAKGSWGFQAGAEQIDLLLLVMNEQGVQKFLANKVTLGADVSVAAGPVGRQGSIGTDAQLKTEILSYSRARGLFAGVNLSGGVLRTDSDANMGVYGDGASPRTILANRELSAPTQAAPFLSALTSTSATEAARSSAIVSSSASTGASGQQPAASEPATRRTTTVPTNDDDVRARAMDVRQAIDHLLANAAPAPVGTTGATSGAAGNAAASGPVTVDRAQLLQLRQQVDALIAALNRR
jgi:lipid-binding SYLF domain-containing protein